MSYATQDIIDALKGAREAKGLSQRALSKRTGVPQSHISKIETGGADIRLSSLIELARALDLDLKLVPRKAVPAVDNIVRSTAPTIPATPAFKELTRTLETVKNLRVTYPELTELKKLQDNFETLKNLRNVGKDLEHLREIGKPIRELQKFAETYRKIAEAGQRTAKQIKAIQDAAKVPAEQLEALQQAARSAQTLRNQLVHVIPEQPSLPRPAYRLDEDGENDHG
jgi:transcriptional regulator with XRE-family HTH domain